MVISILSYGLAFVVIGVSFLIWVLVLLRVSRREVVIPASPRRDVPWRGVHVALAFFIYIVVPGLTIFLVRWKFEIPASELLPDDNIDIAVWSLASMSIFSVVAALLVMTYLKIDMAAIAEDFGWSSDYALGDVALGFIAFVAIAPPVYALQNLLVHLHQLIYDEPAMHPLIELVEDNPTPSVILWSTVSAVLVAPIVEEFLFRVVFQGWLEKMVGIAQRVSQPADHNTFSSTSTTDPSTTDNPYASPGEESLHGSNDGADLTVPSQTMLAPILISSILFAFFHVGHGPAPIPLFFLALVLGYLYQKTHRIMPSLVVHMALNGSSMLVLWLTVG